MGDIKELYNDETEVRDTETVPNWVDEKISWDVLAAICEGGCSSGAYMPAVYYSAAAETMARYGDEVLEYLDDAGITNLLDLREQSWSGLACLLLSAAVETWAFETVARRIDI